MNRRPVFLITCLCFGFAFFASLAFEAPFINLDKLLIAGTARSFHKINFYNLRSFLHEH